MNLIVNKTLTLRGKVLAPSSKSMGIRGLLLALLSSGKSTISNMLDADDTQAAMRVCTALGAKIQISPTMLTIISEGCPISSSANEINTGNSGITTLFTLPILGLRKNYNDPIVMDCGEQMRARPISPLVGALQQLGMNINYLKNKGQLPISVTGQLMGGVVEIDGVNSQYLSALLMSLPCVANDSDIIVKELHERPYIEMTLRFLNQHKIEYTHKKINNVDYFSIRGNQHYLPQAYIAKGDFSSSSCLIAAAMLLSSDMELYGLDFHDSQGDKRLLTILQDMGGKFEIKNDALHIKGPQSLTGIAIDANDIPDLLPALAVIGTQASGKTEIYNVIQARIKETDRIQSMTEGLKRLGAKIEEHPDGMTIYQSKLQGSSLKGYNDHRTVMALTVAGMIADGTTLISDGEAINKTYPEFINTLQKIGSNVSFDKISRDHHIILIGFKHVGKTRIGHQLAKALNKKFIDLDKEIEKHYQKHHAESYTCKQIMLSLGEDQYRQLESEVLEQVLQSSSCVISLGGGTPLSEFNRTLIKPHKVIHVTAARGIVFERIMVEGRPVFFNPNEDPYDAFSRFWEERNMIYKELTPFKVDNSTTLAKAVSEAITLFDH